MERKLNVSKSLSEEQLIMACQKNNRLAQKTLYETMSPIMLGVCLRYISDQSEAEHIMIGGMIKMFNNIKKYKKQGLFKNWVRRIIINECLLYIRKNKAMWIEEDIETANIPPDFDIINDELEVDDLLTLINTLPVGYRMVFNLYAIEGYSHQEISKMLNININTSKSQLSRARKWLQTKLVNVETLLKKTMI